ncbi:uncharacterized protein LOC119285633 isoform X1 [Triticum dicoccoides]|uniref:uncharacterized protein LOC119285633 isoform X1 n=1 Tax=Triticum dicoccoides TaxID=85692 RepID=UPI00188F2E68|nr:uncharacterized protein LOC119285633 isoform X1 [Triticum dicoccoides]XP_037420864.1 uncharacterized protein LOC119285633 isoform X1 [Triticum dicoccoides]XP_037420866.1 uncharacterized protein LOC119285633 isoform X1 [Triticum dicoccoides]XP_037420867.1 uncharacterized protein LOC119285633 isoform X1 [Triticum dicoccoides]
MVGSSARVGWSSGGKGVAKQYYLQGRNPEAVPPDDGRLTRGSYWRRPTRAPWPHLCSSGPARQLQLQIVGPAWRLPLQLGGPAGPVASAATRSCRWCARCWDSASSSASRRSSSTSASTGTGSRTSSCTRSSASPSCPWHASRMACAVWEHKPGKLLSRCGAVHGAVIVVLTPWPLPLPSEKTSLACGGGGYYWSGGTFCFPFSSFLERHNMYEEEAMRTTRVEMGMGGELWDDSALVDCLDHAVPPTRHAAGRMVWN